MTKEELLSRIEANVIEARVDVDSQGLFEIGPGSSGVVELIEEALKDGVAAQDIVSNAITTGMTKVGQLYQEGELFLPEMLMAADAVEAAMSILRDYLSSEANERKGIVVLATVKGDVHNIGKNIVGLVLRGAGYEVRDLGVDVEPAAIVQSVQDSGADLVGLSALLTTTMAHMRDTIEELSKAGLRERVVVIIGGAPVSQAFADEIGADFYGRDAFDAVNQMGTVLEKRQRK